MNQWDLNPFGYTHFYSRIHVNGRVTYRCCDHNSVLLPTDDDLLINIKQYPIYFDDFLRRFDHLQTNDSQCYAYHMVIEGLERYFNLKNSINVISREVVHKKNNYATIKIKDINGYSYNLTSSMILYIFILRKIKIVDCEPYKECVLTRLFDRFEFDHTKFIQIKENIKPYRICKKNIYRIPVPIKSEITECEKDYLNLNELSKFISKDIKSNKYVFPHMKQILLINWEGYIDSIIVRSIKYPWVDGGILGKRKHRCGVKLYGIHKNVIIYPDDSYIQDVIVFRDIFIDENNKRHVEGVIDPKKYIKNSNRRGNWRRISL